MQGYAWAQHFIVIHFTYSIKNRIEKNFDCLF
jgi:hypothetical protein